MQPSPSKLATWEQHSPSLAMQPTQWAQITVPSFSVIIDNGTGESFIFCECLTFSMTQETTLNQQLQLMEGILGRVSLQDPAPDRYQ